MRHLGLIRRRTSIGLVSSEDRTFGMELEPLVAVDADPLQPSDDLIFAVDGIGAAAVSVVGATAVVVVALKRQVYENTD